MHTKLMQELVTEIDESKGFRYCCARNIATCAKNAEAHTSVFLAGIGGRQALLALRDQKRHGQHGADNLRVLPPRKGWCDQASGLRARYTVQAVDETESLLHLAWS